MKSPVAPLGAHLRGLINEARETAAAPVDPESLRDLLVACARKGFVECRVLPTSLVDIRGTKVAAAAEAYLTKQGLRFSWALGPSVIDPKTNPGRSREEYFELVVQME